MLAHPTRRKRGDVKTRARVQRLREKRRQSGMKAFEVWLLPEMVERLKQPHESVSQLMARALTTLQAQETPEPAPMTGDTPHPVQYKESMLARLRAMHAEGLTLQAIANRLNSEGVRTLTGRGRWHKGTIADLLAQG